jgi:hypothetical protein
MRRLPSALVFLLAPALLALTAVVEFLMGRSLLPQTARLQVWTSEHNGPQTSQHLTDWYSLSHLLHGFLFYWGYLLLTRRRLAIQTLFLLTLATECAWEILENSPIVIARYRATNAQTYAGDTIVNSLMDIAACALGFLLARTLPTWLSIALIVASELLMAWCIHDNLTLNILMLIHPFEAIKHWQAAAP